MQNSQEHIPKRFNVDPSNMQEYLNFQRAIMEHDFNNPEFIEEVKQSSSSGKNPSENELAEYWVLNNSARFRDDPEFRASKIAELSPEEIKQLHQPN